MFTGIIQEQGRVLRSKTTEKKRTIVLSCSSRFAGHVRKGSSVACDGACLTVLQKSAQLLSFELLPETIRSTTLGEWRKNDRVNLESALRIGDELGGHIVQGHVDGVGVVRSRRDRVDSTLLEIVCPSVTREFFVPKGSIAVNGVSLTVVRVRGRLITVSLTPFTLTNTNLGALQKEGRVNIEADLLVKIVRSL